MSAAPLGGTGESTAAPLRVGTRGSLLALAQTHDIAARFAGVVEIVEISTKGDVDRSPLSQLGGTGVFVSALRDALLGGEIDVAVHSMKDLPTLPQEGIRLAAVPVRNDPRDALVARDGLQLKTLPKGAKVGTGSPRRKAQLLHARPDLHVVDIRGNITTRMNRALAENADLDAVVLAVAGLNRGGFSDRVSEALSTAEFLPAPAQGALGIETRDGDERSLAAVAGVDDPVTAACAAAERIVLRGLEAGCAAPVGAFASADGDSVRIDAAAYALDGSRSIRASREGAVADSVALANDLVAELLDGGAKELVG